MVNLARSGFLQLRQEKGTPASSALVVVLK